MSPEEQFWKWFESHTDSLMNLRRNHTKVIEGLGVELSKVSEGLTFQVGPKESYGREFVVSADGMPERFSSVIRLVGAAPALPGWKIVAFRQPKGTHFTIEFGGISCRWLSCGLQQRPMRTSWTSRSMFRN